MLELPEKLRNHHETARDLSMRLFWITGLSGLGIIAEEPGWPDLVLDHHGPIEPDAAVDLIRERLMNGERVSRSADPPVQFRTKAGTLERLAPRIRNASALPQFRFQVSQWRKNRDHILARIEAEPWGKDSLAVRSSAQTEDVATGFAAGKYDSAHQRPDPYFFTQIDLNPFLKYG